MINLPNGTVFIERTGPITAPRWQWEWTVYYIQYGEERAARYHLKTKWGAKRIAKRVAKALQENTGQPRIEQHVIYKPKDQQ